MRGATAHDWPVGNTYGRCAVVALGGAPLTSCAAQVWHRAEILGLGTSGARDRSTTSRRRACARQQGGRGEWHMETGWCGSTMRTFSGAVQRRRR